MSELRDKCKKAANRTVLLLYMIAAFVCGYCIAKERGDRRGIRWSKLPWDELNWLNKGHWDYRGLIEKGLAIDATGLNVY